MLNPPETLKAPAFPYHDWPENVPPSQQLVALYLTLPSHRENVHRMVQLLKAGATAKAFMNHPHLGLRKLGNWHKDRAKSFARAAHRGPHSPELEEWPAIAWHLGPCPLMGRQASVHRIDDLQSYTIGFLEWADKGVQAVEKAADKPESGCKVKWQGKYISDRQLIDKLKSLGIVKTELSVRKFRQNNKTKHPDLDALHDAMLQKWGALEAAQAKPFKYLPDFLGDAPPVAGIHPAHEWERLFKVHKTLRLSPLEIQRKVALELEANISKTLARIGSDASVYRERLENDLQITQGFIRKVHDKIRDMTLKQAHHLDSLHISENPDQQFQMQPVGFHHKPAPPAPAALPLWADPAVKICTIADLEEWRAKANTGEESAYFRAKLPYSQWFDGPALIQLEKEHQESMDQMVNSAMKELGL